MGVCTVALVGRISDIILPSVLDACKVVLIKEEVPVLKMVLDAVQIILRASRWCTNLKKVVIAIDCASGLVWRVQVSVDGSIG